MKPAKYFKTLFLTGLAVITLCKWSPGQEKTTDKDDGKKTAIKNMLDSQHFVFVAESTSPLRGRFRNLTSEYDVTVSKDTVVSYLPYFGRAYTAPLNPSGSGLDFTSTDFSYSVMPYKKDGWNVMIKPKDHTDVQQFLFTIYDNGTAHLNVSSISRDAITFNGYIKKEEIKKKAK